MGRNKKKRNPNKPAPKVSPAPAARRQQGATKAPWIVGGIVLLAAVILFAVLPGKDPSPSPAAANPPATPGSPPAPPLPPSIGVPEMLRRPNPEPINDAALSSMEINQAVMVTVELDFGGRIPSIAEALTQIERRSTPADGQGRTFAILDAYGDPTDDGKLHISMHISTEKPGIGALVFNRTDEYLWQSRILPSTNISKPFGGKDLTILIDDGKGRNFTIDGSSGPPSILEATVKELQLPLRQIWEEGQEREMTYIYSACGCPVKVKARREGERTVRTSEMPVIFPDDPAVVQIISRLMGW